MPQLSTCSSCLTIPHWGFSTGTNPLALDPSLTFPAIRHALMGSLPTTVVDAVRPLSLWTSDAQLGSAIAELWAYVGDVLGLYNWSIATESLMPVTPSRRSIRRLSALLGYNPRPAVGSQDEIAAFVSEAPPVNMPATRYRSSASSSAEPQVFETGAKSQVSRGLNEVALRPLLETPVGELAEGQLLIESETASAVRGRPIALIWYDEIVKAHATEILDVVAVQGLDGRTYVKATTATPPSKLSALVPIDEVILVSPSQTARARTSMFIDDEYFDPIEQDAGFADPTTPETARILGITYGSRGFDHVISEENFTDQEKSQSSVDMDGVYRAIAVGDFVILQYNNYYSAHKVMNSSEVPVPMRLPGNLAGPPLPLTRLILNPAIDKTKIDVKHYESLIIHYNLHDVGRLTRVSRTELTVNDLLNKTLPLEGVHDPATKSPGEFILEDANGRGELVEGTLAIDASGAATLKVTKAKWDGSLRAPIKAYGNVLHVTRGETVEDEVLGDGDPSRPYQTFQLAKSPLTYLPSSVAPSGVASTLEVRVGGILWHERPSFYGAGPNDAVYIVRHDDDQNTHITFGDGVRGMRPPTGSRNVRATYRYGAGAATPTPGGINQIVKGAPGLLRVRSPIRARGGSDAENVRDLRRNAPASALILGRCVSLADFSARVAGIPGIRNSKVEYAWDKASLTAGVKVWYIANDPGVDMSKDIIADLQAMSEPGMVIRAEAAKPISAVFFLNLEIDRDHLSADIEAAVRDALLNPETGMLAVENTPIGGPISRSAFVAVARTIAGVIDVTSVHHNIDTGPDSFPPPGLLLGPGEYFDFDDDKGNKLVIGAVPAESRGCRELVL